MFKGSPNFCIFIPDIRSKCNALLVKYLLPESETNCYINAVIRRYVMNEEVIPKPVEPPYMTKNLIANIRLVLQETASRETKRNLQDTVT